MGFFRCLCNGFTFIPKRINVKSLWRVWKNVGDYAIPLNKARFATK